MGVGLKPVALITNDNTDATHIHGVPVIETEELGSLEPYLKGRGYALLTGDAESRAQMMDIILENPKLFPHVLVVPECWEFSCFWVSPKNLGGFLGLEVREQIFHPSKRMLKRVLDIVMTLGILVAIFPLLLAIGIAIKIDSPGPILYWQRRVGRGGIEFRAWKLRSMVRNAEALLNQYLEDHPELALEWRQNQKLRNDPRITRVGRFLRRTSLDEIPQLWNVLRGDMSLVGPRPIVRDEISRYGKYFHLYTRVNSGITGLWQVSGRSETSYEQRVSFDTFYVRNWSVWLDLCILFRTISVIWMRTGAY
jgi:Undecaprenyl-phosphate galactose phosphotransferase WbaP